MDILKNLRLLDSLDSIVVSDIVGYHKPQPEIFINALMALRVPASAAVHDDDDLEADVEGARQAGIRPIWLDPSTNNNANLPDKIQSLDELLSML